MKCPHDDSSAKAKMTGADLKNPLRFLNRGDPPTARLGAPSAWMKKDQIAAWEAFQREIPWLAESDRALLEIAVTIRAGSWPARRSAFRRSICCGRHSARWAGPRRTGPDRNAGGNQRRSDGQIFDS